MVCTTNFWKHIWSCLNRFWNVVLNLFSDALSVQRLQPARSAISCRYLPSSCEVRIQSCTSSELQGAILAGLAQVYGHGQGGNTLGSVTKNHTTQHNQTSFWKFHCAKHYANDCKTLKCLSLFGVVDKGWLRYDFWNSDSTSVTH